jgi:hypothetical protein
MKKLLMVVAISAMVVSGCVSVERTRAQLNSNNPQEVKNAEETIFTIATTGKDKSGFVTFDVSQQIEYIQLSSNQDLLAKIFAETWYNDKIGVAVAKKMDFSQRDSIVSFIKNNKDVPVWRMQGRGESVKTEIINAMLSTATADGLAAAIKYFNSDRSLFELKDIEKPLTMKLVDISTDQDLMFQVACSDKYEDSIKDIALSKLTDQAKLMSLYCNLMDIDHDKVLAKLQDKTICNFILNDPRYKEVSKWGFGSDEGWAARKLVGRIKDENQLANILIGKTDMSGLSYLINGIKDEKTAARIVIEAKNSEVRQKVAKTLKTYDVIVTTLMNNKVTDENLQLVLIENIEDGTADVKLYDDIKNQAARKAVFSKLSKEARIEINGRNKAECEKLIVDAKNKGSETFELGGFYLGMMFEDAKKLIGYHFPDFFTEEKKDDDGDKSLYVSYQKTPFCYANKNGKIYQFNFGKKMLKKWYKYDVQTYMEWAHAYERENKIDMKFKLVEKDTTVYEPDMSRSYRVWFHQESYQYKHNTKEYRLTYFGEEKDFTFEGGIGGAIIKEMAAPRFRYVRGDPGSLRAVIERD